MQLREIMTPNVVTARLSDDVLSVARLMRDHQVGCVVICEVDGGPCGIVTDHTSKGSVVIGRTPLAHL